MSKPCETVAIVPATPGYFVVCLDRTDLVLENLPPRLSPVLAWKIGYEQFPIPITPLGEWDCYHEEMPVLFPNGGVQAGWDWNSEGRIFNETRQWPSLDAYLRDREATETVCPCKA